MRLALLVALLASSSFAQPTTISDTIRFPGPTGPGPLIANRITISWSAFYSSTGALKPAGMFTLPIANGLLNVTLESTTNATFVGSSTPGIFYTVRYFLNNGNSDSQKWTFPYSPTPITMAGVTILTVSPAATASIGTTQLIQGGANDGDCLIFSLASHAYLPKPCPTGGGGGGVSFDSHSGMFDSTSGMFDSN